MMKAALLALLVGVALAAPVLHEKDLAPLYMNGEVIPNSYIVVFQDDVEIPSARAFADAMNGDRFLHIGRFRAFSGVFSGAILRKIRERTDIVKFIEADQVVRTTYRETGQQNNATWGIDRVDQRNLPLDSTFHYYDSAGSGVDVYVIDTGINIAHQDFGGRAKLGYNFHAGNGDAEDDNGHGTHCAGTIAGSNWGLAKKANLIAVKVLGALGSGSLSNVAAGVEWAAQQHNSASGKKSVANMSLGGGASLVLDNAVEAAIEDGLIVVVASGNSDADACNSSPARVSTAITVNASTNRDARASFSNWGSCTHIFAPGQDITSAWIGSTSATRTISGTSMACPHVVGAVALMLGEKGAMTPAAAKSAIIDASTPNVLSDVSGSPNRLLYSTY